MDRANNLKGKIKKFLNRDVYISDDEDISIFDLISNLIANNAQMKSELSAECCLEKSLEKVEYESELKYLYLCYYSTEKENMKILVDKYKNGRFQQRITILKSIKGEKISSSSSRFLKKYYNEIEKSFSVLKKYLYLFSDDNTIEVNDDIFNLYMYFNPSLGINSDIYLNYNHRKIWCNQEFLPNVEDYKKEIFKRVHVPVSNLPELYQKALDNSYKDQIVKTKKLK